MSEVEESLNHDYTQKRNALQDATHDVMVAYQAMEALRKRLTEATKTFEEARAKYTEARDAIDELVVAKPDPVVLGTPFTINLPSGVRRP